MSEPVGTIKGKPNIRPYKAWDALISEWSNKTNCVSFFISMSSADYYNKWCCHYYFDYYYYCCCPLCKECVLYIVIKKSCWTVTYSFESGLNFIYVGTVNGGGAYVFLKLDCFFFFFHLESISNENKLTIWKWLLFVIVLVYSFPMVVLHY